VVEPVSPSYLFVKLTLGKGVVSLIRSTKGSLDLLRFG